MGFTLAGLLLMSVAPSFGVLLVAAALVGCGSSVFHPESSRVARMASGGRHGLAQSLFQVGGNAGSSLGPLLAALIVIPHGQRSIAWFSVAALVAIVVLTQIGRWYKQHPAAKKARSAGRSRDAVAQPGHVRDGRADAAGVLEVLLPRQHQQLFHVLSDRQVPSARAGRSGPSVRIPRSRLRQAR